MTTVANTRTADHAVDPLFLDRWSPRAFTDEMMSDADLMILFEAARWAPSSYNSQPWHFIYAKRGSADWDRLVSLLNPFNQSWAKSASVLMFLVSNPLMRPPGADRDVLSRSHSFDAGAAWASLALQAARLGWQAHGMVGVDFERAVAELGVPADHRIEAAIAIGRPGDRSQLPEAMQAREQPSARKSVIEFVSIGRFDPAFSIGEHKPR